MTFRAFLESVAAVSPSRWQTDAPGAAEEIAAAAPFAEVDDGSTARRILEIVVATRLLDDAEAVYARKRTTSSKLGDVGAAAYAVHNAVNKLEEAVEPFWVYLLSCYSSTGVWDGETLGDAEQVDEDELYEALLSISRAVSESGHVSPLGL